MIIMKVFQIIVFLFFMLGCNQIEVKNNKMLFLGIEKSKIKMITLDNKNGFVRKFYLEEKDLSYTIKEVVGIKMTRFDFDNNFLQIDYETLGGIKNNININIKCLETFVFFEPQCELLIQYKQLK